MGNDFFERLPARFLARELGLELLQLAAKLARELLALGEVTFNRFALLCQGLQPELPRGHTLSQLSLHLF